MLEQTKTFLQILLKIVYLSIMTQRLHVVHPQFNRARKSLKAFNLFKQAYIISSLFLKIFRVGCFKPIGRRMEQLRGMKGPLK
jgi:hypothetical protein